jgi:hypothetical protein
VKPLTNKMRLILMTALMVSSQVLLGASYTYLLESTKTPKPKLISAQITPRSLTPIGEQGEGIGIFSVRLTA